MSEEEMIDIIKGLVFGTFDKTTAIEREALDMFIKRLDQDSCGDCISRQAVLTLAKAECDTAIIPYRRFVKDINDLPPVTPKTGLCKDCKWWKDSDGAFRRGIGAESQCPINRKEVYDGEGYCFLYEPNTEIEE